MGGDLSESSPLVAPGLISQPFGIELEAGPEEQIQCRTASKPTVGTLLLLASLKEVRNIKVCLQRLTGSLACTEGRVCLCSLHYLKWWRLKFRLFVTRDILFIFFAVQLVISLLAYLMYLLDGYQKFWLRLTWGFDGKFSFYYICEFVLNAICPALVVCGLIAPCALKLVPVLLVSGCLGGAGEAGLPLLLLIALVVLALFAVVGIFYSVLVATMVGQRIWQRHYHILAKRMLTKYVVEDVDDDMSGSDWSPPTLPPEHVQQLKSLGLL